MRILKPAFEAYTSDSSGPYTYQEKIIEFFFKHIRDQMNQGLELGLDKILQQLSKELELDLSERRYLDFLKAYWEDVWQLKFLDSFIDDDKILEIYLHGTEYLQLKTLGAAHLIEGQPHFSGPGYQQQVLELALDSLAYRYQVEWNLAHPFASFQIKLGMTPFRATLIHGALTPHGKSKLFLRRLNAQSFQVMQFCKDSPEIEALITQFIQAKKNVIVSGPTGSGKTSLVQAMVQCMPVHEHLIILEDTHELIGQGAHITSLLAKGTGNGHSLKDYCAYALRMSPDRIILGEMRSREIVPFILAMNTGHRGLLSTVHANSAAETVSRLGMLFSLYSESKDLDYATIIKLICQNIDYIVYMEDKRVKEVVHLLGSEGTTPYFEYEYQQT